MTDNKIKISDAYIEKSESKKIRVFKENGNIYFSVKDLLLACGVKAPDKWINRHRSEDWNIFKRIYPSITAGGYRAYPMYFADEATTQEIVEITCKSNETKKWIHGIISSIVPVVQHSHPIKTQSQDTQDINSKIDAVISSLLEMKNYIFSLR